MNIWWKHCKERFEIIKIVKKDTCYGTVVWIERRTNNIVLFELLPFATICARAVSRGRFTGCGLFSVNGESKWPGITMDFSVLVADLRDVAEKYKGKTTEPQVSTVVYVDMFTKVCYFVCRSDLHPLDAPVSLPWMICTESRTPILVRFSEVAGTKLHVCFKETIMLDLLKLHDQLTLRF